MEQSKVAYCFFLCRHHSHGKTNAEKQSHMMDLLDVNLGNPSPQPVHGVALDPWGFPQPAPQSPPARPQVSMLLPCA